MRVQCKIARLSEDGGCIIFNAYNVVPGERRRRSIKKGYIGDAEYLGSIGPDGRTPLTGGKKSGGVEKREHRSVSYVYERKQHRTEGCVAGILPEPGLQSKRANRRRQYREPWQETGEISL